MSKESLADMIDEMRSSEENNRIVASVNLSSWSDEEKMKAIVASRYLNSVGKGENALELSVALKTISNWLMMIRRRKYSMFLNIYKMH